MKIFLALLSITAVVFVSASGELIGEWQGVSPPSTATFAPSGASESAIQSARRADTQPLASAVLVERLGWTLIHSLWQLTLIAALAAMINRSLKHRTANTRYIAAVTAFSLMAIIPAATWNLNVGWDQRSEGSPMVTWGDTVEGGPAKFVVVPAQITIDSSPSAADVELVDIEPFRGSHEFAGTAAGSPSHGNLSVVDRPDSPQDSITSSQSMIATVAAWIQLRLPLIVGIWLIGIIVCSARPIWSLWIQWHLRRRGLSPAPESMQTAITQLASRMQLTRIVRIAESALVKVPMVVGYLRPMILLPASVIVGLTPIQLEAVLAHELAHIRRHDWLINALQVMAETLLFYHPAVWWLSNRIRRDRELCCDNIALSLNVDKAVYARTLLTLEELRQKTFTPALAATGGDLAGRVRRLLPSGHIEPQFGMGAIMGLLSVVVSLLLLATSLAASSESREPNADTEVAATATDEPKPVQAPEDTAVDEEPQPAKPIEGVRRRSVQVLDESELPVAGAEVQMQFIYGSDNGVYIGEMMSEKSNEKGNVEVVIPPEAGVVQLTVRADGFGEFSEQQQATGSSSIRLKRGRVIHVRAVDEAGTVLKKAVPLLAEHRVIGREFLPQEDGTFKSPSVHLRRRLMRVVSAQENGPMLFSELVDVAEATPGADGILELALKRGTKLTGRLDDSVPRPISEGYVQLMIV
ncbi:MAG: M56 family metallopeptidase, partial [Planctomycetota bacterium]|nr:M56 family metallopeptidase [Planctomycetota bacterium]